MELKNKIEAYLLLLENDKSEIMIAFLKWMNFLKIQQEDINISYVEEIFNKVLIKIKNIENALTGDLEDNYDNFLEFFTVGVSGGTDCHKDIQDLIFYMQKINEDDDKEEKIDKEEASIEKFVELVDKFHFIQFRKTVHKFYTDMSNLLDDVFDYADELYIHHTGDETVCGTRTK